MAFKIYTKTGDQGETSLIGGTRVPKFHLRIEAYGTLDELNSYIGVIRDQVTNESTVSLLQKIQDRLFTIGSELATDPNSGSRMKVPDLRPEDITLLETEIDRMNEVLPELRNFVLPGGSLAASHCHVARCICRRAERLTVHLGTESEIPELIIPYLNRLSDFLFVLSRFLLQQQGGKEVNWTPRF